MSDSVRKEVSDYLFACESLLNREAGAHDKFILASEILRRRDRKLTDAERTLVQRMISRVAEKTYE